MAEFEQMLRQDYLGGFIPAQKTAAPLLAKTSDGPPTLE